MGIEPANSKALEKHTTPSSTINTSTSSSARAAHIDMKIARIGLGLNEYKGSIIKMPYIEVLATHCVCACVCIHEFIPLGKIYSI